MVQRKCGQIPGPSGVNLCIHTRTGFGPSNSITGTERKPPLSSWSWDILPQNSWAVGFGFMKRRAIYPRELKPRERYSRTQKIAAVEHYLTHGGCLSYTRRAIGYPSNEILKRWIEEFYPNARPLVIRSGTSKCFSPQERSQAVRELCNRRGTARKVAQSIGVSVPVLYKWKKRPYQ